MISLKVLGSSSKGNCFILNDDDRNIIIDCGVKNTVSYVDINKTDAILLSHGHIDHCGDVKNIKKYYNGLYYGNDKTLEILPILENQKYVTEFKKKFEIGNFTILPFEVHHDFKNNGYLIKHNPSGMKILYIIDTSAINELIFKDIDVFIIEANHSYEWLFKKEVMDFKDYRTYGSEGHLAIEDTIDFLINSVNYNTKKIILTHISSSCEDYKEIENKVKESFKNTKLDIIALDPHMKEPITIVLKEDIQGFDFD